MLGAHKVPQFVNGIFQKPAEENLRFIRLTSKIYAKAPKGKNGGALAGLWTPELDIWRAFINVRLSQPDDETAVRRHVLHKVITNCVPKIFFYCFIICTPRQGRLRKESEAEEKSFFQASLKPIWNLWRQINLAYGNEIYSSHLNHPKARGFPGFLPK